MADYGLGSRVRACRLSSQLPELWPEGSHAATPTSPEAAPLRLVPASRPSACLPRTPPCVHPALLCPSASSPLPMRPSAWLCPCHHPPRPAPLWLPHAAPLCWLCPHPGGGGGRRCAGAARATLTQTGSPDTCTSASTVTLCSAGTKPQASRLPPVTSLLASPRGCCRDHPPTRSKLGSHLHLLPTCSSPTKLALHFLPQPHLG